MSRHCSLILLLCCAVLSPAPSSAQQVQEVQQAQQARESQQSHQPATPERAFIRSVDDPSLQWGPCPPFMPKGCAIAVLHGDPAQANADVLFRVPAGADIPLHWHTSAERMVLLTGELQVTYANQEPTELRAGTYAYGPPKLPHRGHCGNAGACVLFIAFEAPVDAVAGGDPPR